MTAVPPDLPPPINTFSRKHESPHQLPSFQRDTDTHSTHSSSPIHRTPNGSSSSLRNGISKVQPQPPKTKNIPALLQKYKLFETMTRTGFDSSFSSLSATDQLQMAWELFAALVGAEETRLVREDSSLTQTASQSASSNKSPGQKLTVALDSFHFGHGLPPDDSESEVTEDMTPHNVSHTARVRAMSRDACGYEVLNEYTVLDEIGSGASGTVMLALHSKTQEPFAVKAVSKSRKLKFGRALPNFDIEKEVAVMKKLRHRNIVRLHEVIDDPEEHMMYLVMDYVPHGHILDPMQRKGSPNKTQRTITYKAIEDETLLLSYTRQIADGLKYLHRRNVIHRDIKPENLLLSDDDTVKITDFGVSEFSNERENPSKAAQIQGTPAFLAPEVCKGEPSGAPADVWAFGVTLYAMKFGVLPFDGPDTPAMVAKILKDDVHFNDDASPKWKDLLRGMLHKDPAQRTTLKQVCNHPLVTGLKEQVVPDANGESPGVQPDSEVDPFEELTNASITARTDTRIAFFSSKFVANVEKQRQSLGFTTELDPLLNQESVAQLLVTPRNGPKMVLSPARRGRRGTLTNHPM